MTTANSPPKHKLIEIEWPEFGECEPPPPPPLEEYEARIAATRAAMARCGLSHLVVYGDREHCANLLWLTGLDPRFEEALFVLRETGPPLFIVGIECKDYLPISPLWVAGKMRSECFQPFSLLSMPRGESRLIGEILRDEAIDPGSRVGCAGWKYYSEQEHPQGAHTLELPAYLADTLRELAGYDNVVNAAGIFADPDTGLRTFCSPGEVARMEYANILASEGMKRMIFNLREGMTDHELARYAGYNGLPLSCHPTLSTGRDLIGLASPSGEVIRRGFPLSANISYWGSNCCRAGWLASSAQDLPAEARDYVGQFAGPYFAAMAEWFGMLEIGRPGGDLDRLIRNRLPFETYNIVLNAGHLIHFDEWLSSPVYPDSVVKLHSGMALQADVIPSSPAYFSTRMEDTFVLAGETLRADLQARFPDCLKRCRHRRKFMTDVLGIDLPAEVLPLSNMTGIVPPYLMSPLQLLAVE